MRSMVRLWGGGFTAAEGAPSARRWRKTVNLGDLFGEQGWATCSAACSVVERRTPSRHEGR